jgi:hypothetical protein
MAHAVLTHPGISAAEVRPTLFSRLTSDIGQLPELTR